VRLLPESVFSEDALEPNRDHPSKKIDVFSAEKYGKTQLKVKRFQS
jgi:hypothetical protein